MKPARTKHSFLVVFFILFICFSFSKTKAATVTNISSVYKYGQNFLTWTNPAPNSDKYYYLIFRRKKSFGKFNPGDLNNITAFNDYSNPLNVHDAQNSPFFIGYVRGNSSLNSRATDVYHANNIYMSKNFYFFIPTNQYNKLDTPSANLQQLDQSRGLFVNTTDKNGDYYYLVLVWNQSSSVLDKSDFNLGATQILVADEKVEIPWVYFQNQKNPDFKNINNGSLGKSVFVYTMFVSNMKTGNYAAGYQEMVNRRTGYLPFCFAAVAKGNASTNSHFMTVNFHGGGGSFLENDFKIQNDEIELTVDDWLPNSSNDYDNSGFFGYNEEFDVYNKPSFIPPLLSGSGNKLYTSTRILNTISFLKANGVYLNPSVSKKKWTVDGSRIYGKGTSMGAGGLMIIAQISPSTFAAVQLAVPKFNAGFIDNDNPSDQDCEGWNYCHLARLQRDSMFGCVTFSGDPNFNNDPLYSPLLCPGCSTNPQNVNLFTDWPAPGSGQKTYNIADAGFMAIFNSDNSADLPLIFAVNGRHDCMVGWQEKVKGNWNGMSLAP